MDFALALVTPASFFGFAAVLREYKRTGVFDWIIERHDYQTGDSAFSITSVLAIMFIFLPAYFVISWVLEKPTPGSCVCDFRIVTDNGSPLSPWKAWLRALLGCFALIAWPSWILAYWVKRDKEKGKFWLDQIFKTHAEFLE